MMGSATTKATSERAAKRKGRYWLSATAVESAKTPGLYGDGAGLYLQVSKHRTKSWVFRYTVDGRTREMGLGPFPAIKLADARELAAAARRAKVLGEDPIEARRAAQAAKRAEAAKAVTFRTAADRYINSHKASWRNTKHAAQWSATLEAYVYPVFGKLSVGEIDTGLVTKALEPIWTTKPETASRVRGRIEVILDWARVRGYCSGENPARWRGHLDKLLPARSRVRGVKHHAALPFDELPAFMPELRAREGVAPRALEFAILTAARTGEVIGATWDEIDLAAKVWTVPAGRMKGKREHRVPLSDRAVKLLSEIKAEASGEFVFPGGRKGAPLSNMALLATLKRMDRPDLTAHGFRSTFRDWAAERTSYPGDLVEMALAHTISNKVEAAYRRGDLFEKRRRLMDAWTKFCDSPPKAAQGDNVTPFERAAHG